MAEPHQAATIGKHRRTKGLRGPHGGPDSAALRHIEWRSRSDKGNNYFAQDIRSSSRFATSS
jgi:hypothetical protein